VLTNGRYAEYVVVVAINKHGDAIGESRLTRTIPTENEDASPDRLLASSASVTYSGASQTTDVRPQWTANEMDEVTSPTTSPAGLDHGTWVDFVRDQHFVALASGLGGFIACAALIATIWALAQFRVRSWWRSGSADYAPLHQHQQDENDNDDDELEVQNKK
jgi:hypothetical protein